LEIAKETNLLFVKRKQPRPGTHCWFKFKA